MASLTDILSDIAGQAFAACGLAPEFGKVRVSDRPDLAQFQCNGAMAAAKQAKKNPRAVAEEILVQLKTRPEFSKIEIAGPGFINLNVTGDFLASFMTRQYADARLGVPVHAPDTAVLDYGGPNIAKPMHVGHLRAAIIGDSLRRLMTFAGFKTLGDVHMGDWGTHMGMIVSEFLKTEQYDRVCAINLDDAAVVAALMEELSALYPRVSAECKENEARRALALEATVHIQNGEARHHRLWQIIREASVRGMRANYDLLGVHFDLWKGEADVHGLIAPMVEKLKAAGFAREDDGALIVPVAVDGDKKEMPPLILYKRDGAVMYGTTDMATLVERMDLYNPAKIVYVVDQRQSLHFEQVFRAALLAKITPEGVELTHAGFGTMNGPDGKPFKTRAGGVMRLEDLIALGLEKARQRIAEAELAQEFGSAEKEDIAHKVAIAAIKFADLQNQRLSDYVFDIDRMMSFEGKTGPYLLYQAVRIKSLLRKAGWAGAPQAAFHFAAEDEKLALLLGELPDVIDAALSAYAPHHLCEYAYRVAQQFSSFYGSCHILSETDEAVKSSRLALCALTLRHLELVLELLGIKIPDRM